MAFAGLGKRLREIFGSREIDGKFYEELEDALIEADVGVRYASETIEALRETARKEGIRTREELRGALTEVLGKNLISAELDDCPGRAERDPGARRERRREDDDHRQAGTAFSRKQGR